MFVLPFLKYFKPFRGRIIWAILCMIAVGVLSAAPMLIGREAIDVFMTIAVGKGQDVSEISGFVKPSRGHALTGAASHATAGKPKNKLSQTASDAGQWLDTRATALLGRAYTGPRAWVATQARTVQAFALTSRTLYDFKATESPFELMIFFAVLLVLLVMIKGFAEFSSKYQLAYTFFLTNLRIREDIFGNILRQDYLYFNSNSPGYLHSRINSDVKSVRTILEGLISDGIQQPVTILSMYAVLLILNAKLTLIVMALLPVIGGILYYMAKVLRKNTAKQKKKEDQLSSSLTESLANIRLVKAFGTEDVEMGKFHERTMALFRYIIARRVAKFGSSPLMEFLGYVAASAIMLIGGWLIINDKMKIADFAIYLVTLTRFYRPLRSLATLTNNYQEARVSSERMLEMLRIKPEIHECPNAIPFSDLKQGIELKDVGFRYDNKQVLAGINITVKAGQKIALAGPSGGGKTTLVNMLARLLDPSEGRILIDGTDLREISLGDWRNHLAIVTQDTFLFDDTVENNIAYGTGKPDPERVQAAARAANAHDFILSLDGGQAYQTRIGTAGGCLSGGQRQRLAIARAIYRNPRILILDEATSALDAQSQAVVQEALSRLMTGRTTFVIAHRISTIRDVDCIYVIDQGQITERGSHDELMAMEGGLYQAMVTKVGLVKDEEALDDDALLSLRSGGEAWDGADPLAVERDV
jgi:subfamily B ATP-binding cassette protein MsbA